MTTGRIIAVIGIAVGLIGVVAAPFVVRYVRTLGKVRCTVDSWYTQLGATGVHGTVA